MAKEKTKGSGVRENARSAVTGRFVKKSYAKKNPRTTVVETGKQKKKG